MSLSKEQQRKINERLEWLIDDHGFREKLRTLVVPDPDSPRLTALRLSDALYSVQVALERFEEEKVAITGSGRYQAQCEELVSHADAFFGNYAKELAQLCVSWFRFAHRVLEDHLGEESGLRAFTIGKTTLMTALDTMLSTIRLLVVDHKE